MKRTALALTAALAMSASAAHAQNVERAIEARKATMVLYAHYLGQLGAMVKGDVEYDADRADSMAKSLNAVASANQSAMWPPNSHNEALGDKTRALPVIWATYPAITEKSKAFNAAAATLADEAGKDLAALRAAFGPVGKSCGGCHETYRQPKD